MGSVGEPGKGEEGANSMKGSLGDWVQRRIRWMDWWGGGGGGGGRGGRLDCKECIVPPCAIGCAGLSQRFRGVVSAYHHLVAGTSRFLEHGIAVTKKDKHGEDNGANLLPQD
jgi:hypothetical protein